MEHYKRPTLCSKVGVLAQLGLAVPIFNLLGGGGGGGGQPKCRYVAQTAYFPTYDTVYKQVDIMWIFNYL